MRKRPAPTRTRKLLVKVLTLHVRKTLSLFLANRNSFATFVAIKTNKLYNHEYHCR